MGRGGGATRGAPSLTRIGKAPGQAISEEGAGSAAPGGPFNRGRALAGPRALAAVAGPEREPERSWGRGQGP